MIKHREQPDFYLKNEYIDVYTQNMPLMIPKPKIRIIEIVTTLGFISIKFTKILKNCDGKRNITEIASIMQIPENEMIEIMKTLAEWKLIDLVSL